MQASEIDGDAWGLKKHAAVRVSTFDSKEENMYTAAKPGEAFAS